MNNSCNDRNAILSQPRTQQEACGVLNSAEMGKRQRESIGMKAEHIAAIESLGYYDAAVHAFLCLKRRNHLGWDDVLAQMVLHLAKEKADLTAKLVTAVALAPPDVAAFGMRIVEDKSLEPNEVRIVPPEK